MTDRIIAFILAVIVGGLGVFYYLSKKAQVAFQKETDQIKAKQDEVKHETLELSDAGLNDAIKRKLNDES